ncbi:DUF4810 domain-containing protein [Gammaproteobacteria bacterium]|jgi:hypothetical protein|nr:DUF4810 domain-containing protein [Gammaproteobacteria bacterium]
MKNHSILLILTIIFLAGCATPNTGYYWENYSGTLYNFKKNPNEKTRARHIKELETIIAKAGQKGSRVPPGIHAELGYMLAQNGEKSTAASHLQKEADIYPESKTFIERIYLMLGLEE